MAIRSQNKICIGSATTGIALLIFSSSSSSVFAHTFTADESAKFISLVDQIKSALVPMSQQDLPKYTAIKEQAQYARALLTQSVLKELNERNQRIGSELPQLLDSIGNFRQDLKNNLSMLNDLLAEALTVRVEREQLRNATIQALALAEDVNKALDEYNAAFNNSTALVNMSKMNNTHNKYMSEGGSSMANVTNEDVKRINAYQRAVALTDLAIDRFNTELKGKSNATDTLDNVANGLEQLKYFIQSKESPTKVTGVVHGDIQSNLQSAFKLELAQHMNGNMGNMGGMSMNNNNLNNSMNRTIQDHTMMNTTS